MENTNTVKQILAAIVGALDTHKAQDIQIIEVTEVTSLADFFIIAEGSSTTQVKALSDYAEKAAAENGVPPARVEGYRSAGWILLDYGSVVVHIFKKETREFYNLERLWQDGRKRDIADFIDIKE